MMNTKNKLLLGLLFTALSLSHAETAQLYGSIRYGYQYQRNNHSSISAPQSRHYSLNHNKRSTVQSKDSFIGIRGHHDLGNGNKLIFQREEKINNRDLRSNHARF